MKLIKSVDKLFTLKINVGKDPVIVIHAFEGEWQSGNHTKIDVEVRQGGKVVFPRGTLYCGIPGHSSIDGNYAKEAVLSLVAMKPGDTDREYFADYTPEQLEWAERYGDDLSAIGQLRYCDENGNVRKE